jgi:glutathione S-transferase
MIYEQTDVIPTMGGLRFRLLTGRLAPTDDDAIRRKQGGEEVLRVLDDHLADRDFFVGASYSVADIAIYGYVHVADQAGIDMQGFAHVRAWLERVRGQARHMNDLAPYPPNARKGIGRSIYG